jgi:hypothetical protein
MILRLLYYFGLLSIRFDYDSPLPSPKGETRAKQPNIRVDDKACIGIGFGFPFRGRKGRLLTHYRYIQI